MKKTIIALLISLVFIGSFSIISAGAVEDNSVIPEYYSSVDLGYTTSIKQQSGNICWSYSSNATLESFLLKNGLYTNDLSHTSIDLWGTTRENGEGWQRSASSAGYGYIPIGYFTSWAGPVDIDENYLNLGITSIRYYSKKETTEIKKAILRNGAVLGDYNSQSYAYNISNTAYYLGEEISNINGHSISVVGWDDNYSKDNFNGRYSPTSDGAWLCKNSWGEYNSHNLDKNNPPSGYFWISYEDYYLFNEEIFTDSYSFEEVQIIKENDSIYQNEIYGATYEFKYLKDDNITFFNKFDFSKQGNVLDKVVFETTALGGKYNIYFTDFIDGKPDTDRNNWIHLSSGSIDYSGYICSDFQDIAVPQDEGCIAVEIDTSSLNTGIDTKDENYSASSLGVCEWLTNSVTKELIFTQQSERGESYVTYGSEIMDLYDFYNEYLNDPVGGTFVIKAITNDTTIIGDVNLDKKININDATTIQKYLANIITDFSFDQKINADFNKDGTIDVNDVTAIQKYLVQII